MSLIQRSIKELEESGERLKKTACTFNAKIIDEVVQEQREKFKALLYVDNQRQN